MNQEGIKAVTDKQVQEFSPKEILSANRIYNLVNSLQFNDLYGIDLTKDFLATSYEQKQAKKFYDEYLTYKDDKEAAEEYELVQHWAEDLNLNKFFELEGEIQYRKRQNLDSFMEAFEKDPLGLDEKDPVKEREMKKFLEGQKLIGTNMAVVMFMVEALQFFEGMKKEEIHKIALDIAMQGTMGYSPDKKDYRISSIKGKVFSGFHILAFYYVSFAIALPEMLSKLELPYDKEYELAKEMYKSDK
jgi:hypothetical protein